MVANTKTKSAVKFGRDDAPHVLVVEARFYEEIGDMLLAGAKAVLETAGATHEVVSVPGALEIPSAIGMALAAMDQSDELTYDGFVVLGCVIRGETSHYDVVIGESNRKVMDIAAEGLAVGNGILTVENEAQAVERADPKRLDKGGDAARACLAMIALSRHFMDKAGM